MTSSIHNSDQERMSEIAYDNGGGDAEYPIEMELADESNEQEREVYFISQPSVFPSRNHNDFLDCSQYS